MYYSPEWMLIKLENYTLFYFGMIAATFQTPAQNKKN